MARIPGLCAPWVLARRDYNGAMDDLLEQIASHIPPEKMELVELAHSFAKQAHRGQTRRSGGPYIEHPVAAAAYLAELSLDAPTIAAALLHDVVEDGGVTIAELGLRFGADVAQLVDGVTKLGKFDSVTHLDSPPLKPGDDAQAESLRKMLVAMAEDIRVVLIKLADRLHNMKTLGALPATRRIAIAQETLDIYAPLAHRLGMGEIKWQLEDLSFRYLKPDEYRSISKLLASKRKEREAYVRQITEVLQRELLRYGFSAEVSGRPKHIYSIHRKAAAYADQGKQLADIFDLFALRVLVPSVQDCYGALGVVHTLWRPLPGQFDDYIASPKENMYQSLHTSVRSIGGLPVEVQLRTYQMHQIAEYGIASHWQYKEGGSPKDVRFEERMSWLRQLLDWQRDMSGTEEFLETVKGDLFHDQVFIYTPKSELREMPSGSTPIDFAYRIHTELGHRCIGAKVNGHLVALDTQLKSGDTVEILTSKVARGPSLDWINPHLAYIRTGNARQAIRAWFRREEHGANVLRGRDLVNRELKRLTAGTDEVELAHIFGYDDSSEFCAAVGSAAISSAQIAERLSRVIGKADERSMERSSQDWTVGTSVLGVGDLLTRMAECCNPLPGDAITGYLARTRGVTIHQGSCPNLKSISEPGRLVKVSWGQTMDLYPVRLELDAFDRMGLLHDITGATSAEQINIVSSQTQVASDNTVTVYVTAQVNNLEQLSRLFSRLERIKGVSRVTRAVQPTAIES